MDPGARSLLLDIGALLTVAAAADPLPMTNANQDVVNVGSYCLRCHMPTASGSACSWGAVRSDLPSHEFAGAAVPSPGLIAAYTAGSPDIDQSAIAAGRAPALAMLQRAGFEGD